MNEALFLVKTAAGGRVRELRGEDDGHAYAVKVPLRCKTVEEAIEWLRPPQVPSSAKRQGEYFFVSFYGDPRALEGYEYTRGGSEKRRMVVPHDGWFGRHRADEALELRTEGDTCFIGRRGRVKSHSWTGRPRYFVRGEVTHPQHATLRLNGWHEIVPNRAMGPWPVSGRGVAGD